MGYLWLYSVVGFRQGVFIILLLGLVKQQGKEQNQIVGVRTIPR
jgi:hypothetical protein